MALRLRSASAAGASNPGNAGQALSAALKAAPDKLSLAEAIELVCTATGWPVGHAWVRVDGNWRSSGEWYADDLERYESLHEVTSVCNLGPGRGVVAAVLHLETTRFLPDLRGLGSEQRQSVAEVAGLRAVVGIPVPADDEVVAVLEFLTAQPVAAEDVLADALRETAHRTTTATPKKGRIPEQLRAAG